METRFTFATPTFQESFEDWYRRSGMAAKVGVGEARRLWSTSLDDTYAEWKRREARALAARRGRANDDT